MRILELIDRMDDGGAQRVVASLALSLQAHGDSVFIVCLRDLGRMPVDRSRFEQAGVGLSELLKEDGFSLPTLRKLVQFVERHRIDVIHTHNPLVHHYGVLSKYMTRTPVVVQTVHGISTLEMARWAVALFKAGCARTDRVVSVCTAVDEAIRCDVGVSKKRTCVIDNGIDLDELLAVPERVPEGPVTFGVIGRLVAVKDHQSLLRAVSIVRQRGVDCRLMILGSGELEPELKSLTNELGLEASVTFAGWSRDIAGFLSRIDALVMSSVSEGLPLAVLEAMAAARPVVSTAVGGVPEILGHGEFGWMCEPSNPAALAEAMMRAMDPAEAGRMGRLSRQRAIDKYSAERMAAQYRSLFADLLGKTARGRSARKVGNSDIEYAGER